MTKEELTKLTVKELDGICKEKELPRYKGKNHLNKTEMINNILGVKEQEIKAEEQQPKEELLANESSKFEYIEKATQGSLIAFVDKKGFTRTGKISEINTSTQHITVELKSGKKFYIVYEDVLWVTSEDNRRWPKKILYALKESQQKIEEEYKRNMEKQNNKVVTDADVEKLNQRFRIAK